MLIAAAGIYHAFGFGVFTMFPIVFCGLGGVLAIAAGKTRRGEGAFFEKSRRQAKLIARNG